MYICLISRINSLWGKKTRISGLHGPSKTGLLNALKCLGDSGIQLTSTPYSLEGIVCLLTASTPETSRVSLLLLVCMWLRVIPKNILFLMGMVVHPCISVLGRDSGRIIATTSRPPLSTQFQASYGFSPGIKNLEYGAEEMPQGLRGVFALAENLGSVPSIHMVAHNHQ